MQIQTISIKEIEPNKGQIKDVPKNPRFIRDVRFNNLKKSIEAYPEMLKIREIVVVKHKKKFVCICGNQRLRACIELGFIEMVCKVLPENTDASDLRGYTLLDNEMYGETDNLIIQNDWKAFESDFEGLGIDFESVDIESDITENEIDISDFEKENTFTITLKYSESEYHKLKKQLSEKGITAEQQLWLSLGNE